MTSFKIFGKNADKIADFVGNLDRHEVDSIVTFKATVGSVEGRTVVELELID